MREEGAPDRAIAEVAARQHGIVDRGQLLRIGLSSSAIGRRVAAGRLHPRHPGVYAVGHAVVSAAGVRWAAVLACGPGAVLSHVSAACAWCMLLRESAVVEVTVGRDGSRSRAGIRTHRRALAADDVTELVGLPITTPGRTLLDLAASDMRGRALERVVDQAERMRLADFGEVGELLERHRGAPGSRSLKTVLARYANGDVDTRSALEDLVVELCDEHGIMRPAGNVVVEGWVRDLFWPHAGLVVEVDSYAYHRSPGAMADDRERDVSLTLAGIRSLRFTGEQVRRRRTWVAGAILTALGAHA
jgi:very-short-patch-repair endonuclease